MTPLLLPRLQVIAAALLFSTGGAVVKSCTFNVWQVAGFRSALAALALAAFAPSARRSWSWRTGAVGCAYAGFLVLFVVANKLTTAANSVFLHYTAPLYVLLLSPWLLQERIRPRDVWFMAALATGMVLFFLGSEPATLVATDPFLGNILAALSGFLWALTLLGFRSLGRGKGATDNGAPAAVLCGCLICFALCLPGSVPVLDATPQDWLLVAYFGLVMVGLAHMSLVSGLRRVPALEASLLLLLEPVLSPLWAWLVHGERVGALALGGGAVILGTTAFRTVFGHRWPQKTRDQTPAEEVADTPGREGAAEAFAPEN